MQRLMAPPRDFYGSGRSKEGRGRTYAIQPALKEVGTRGNGSKKGRLAGDNGGSAARLDIGGSDVLEVSESVGITAILDDDVGGKSDSKEESKNDN